MSDDRLLGLDVGTQSVRALLFDARGELIAGHRVPIAPYQPGEPAAAEQPAVLYWEALVAACAGLRQAAPDGCRQIVAAGLTTQRNTVVPVDRDGQALHPALTWMDKRSAARVPPLPGYLRWAFRLAGLSATVSRFQHDAKSNWLACEAPDVHARMHRFLLLSGYLTHRLTGRFVDSTGAQVGYLPFDYKRQQWADAGSWRWRALGLQPGHMPDLVPCGQPLGPLGDEAARALGLPAGLPVISSGADKACEVLGSGCISPETASLSFGTTATVNSCRPRYMEATRFLPAYPAALPGAWNSEVNIYRGFWLVSWFKQQFGAEEQQVAEARGVAPETLLDQQIEAIPPGSMGLVLQPYWSPGVRDPGPEAKGSIIGFGDVHLRGHVYRAVLEGLIYGLREGAERIERRGRVSIELLRVAGGGAQSDVALQITADVFNRPAERPHTHEASGLGAAINAAVGAGLYPDHASAATAMTRPGRRFTPEPAAVRVYDQLYHRVYRRMYGRLAPLFRDIRAITGYPP
ncbi:MAG: carbohydrate kinase [Salinisphaeraceae bacterium]|nr:carbohydrate kinase [Salinisphaeraceae bacterium]